MNRSIELHKKQYGTSDLIKQIKIADPELNNIEKYFVDKYLNRSVLRVRE